MSFDGNGTFVLIYNWQTDKANGIKIRADRMDAQESDMATGLSTCITKDGQTTVTADIPLNTHKLTGLSAGSNAGDSVRTQQLQTNDLVYFTAAGGTSDAYTLAPSPAPSSLTPGLSFFVRWPATNTTQTPTFNVNGLGAGTIANGDLSQVPIGGLALGGVSRIVYSGTAGWLLTNQVASNPWGLSSGGVKNANFSALGGFYYTVYPPTAGLVAQMENSSTGAGKFVMFIKIGPYPMFMAGTVNGYASTIIIQDRQTLPVSCTTVDGWV